MLSSHFELKGVSVLVPLSSPPPATPSAAASPSRPRSLADDGMPLVGASSLFEGSWARRRVVATSKGPVVIRAATPLDTASVDHFVRALSPTARFRRFHSAVTRLTDRQLAGLVDVDHHDRETLLAVSGRVVVGMGQYLAQTHPKDSVDLAVVVADDWQREGLGRELLIATCEAASATGFRTATAYVQAENRAMLSLLRGVPMPMVSTNEGSVVEVLLDLSMMGAGRA